MDTVKIQNRETLMVAHRGLSGLERENTASAFVAAANRSYYGIETDIYRTADGRFVVNHDGNALRVAGEDLAMETTPWETLREVVLYDMDGSKDRYDLRLPDVETYLTICQRYAKHSVLELKSQFTSEELERLIALIRDMGHLDQVTFISFHYENLTRIRQLLPTQSCQYLTGDNSDAMIEKLRQDGLDIDIAYPALTAERVAAMHAAGLKVNCWTVNDPAIAQDLVDWGVEFITTNILEGQN